MKTYCTDAKLTELTPDLYGAALYMAPYDYRGETTLNRPLKSLVQGAVDAMAEPVDRHIEILLPPPRPCGRIEKRPRWGFPNRIFFDS